MGKYFLCLLWIPMAAVKVIAVLLGFIMVPLALLTRHMTLDNDTDREKHWPDIFWLWGNDEEGYPDWWKDKAKKKWWTRYWPQFWWYTVQNPANNLRFVFKDRLVTYSGDWPKAAMEAKAIVAAGKTSATRWARGGPFVGYRRIWIHSNDKYTEVWFGFKVGSIVPGLGFTTQFRPKREIGK